MCGVDISASADLAPLTLKLEPMEGFRRAYKNGGKVRKKRAEVGVEEVGEEGY
jgi:hypothetical protein